MELEQAWLRLAVAIFLLLAVIFELRGLDHAMQAAPRALWFIVGFILSAATIVLWILSLPRPSPLRRCSASLPTTPPSPMPCSLWVSPGP